MVEQWRDIPGYEGRYQVSDLGRVMARPFMQRYLLRNGEEAFRRTRDRVVATQTQNGGYVMVHLHLNGQRKAHTVHRLVAQAFAPNPKHLPEVNHRDGVKAHNIATNLEWVSRSANKLHAVDLGLNTQARRVSVAGREFPSLSQARRATGVAL